ncbi:hypothetical protein GCM10009759_69420 [Kitasatospora saccharophila]|uniref:MmyB-like transcription regulator ligand binding domain-containing protein n=1 Tax=Kitasatospora saccharophila TaxID=407973 RepID=A0ABP5JNJ0_9ACTN
MISDLGDVLAQNPLSAVVFGGLSVVPPAARNCPRAGSPSLGTRVRFPVGQHDDLARAHTATLRAARATHPNGPRIAESLQQLRFTGAEFADCWDRHEISVRANGRKAAPRPAGVG